MATTCKCDECGCEHKENVNTLVSCRLCQGPTYCNDQCANKGWAQHAAECNIRQVSEKTMQIAMPYAFQDILQDVDATEQAHLMQHMNPAGLISSKVVAFTAPILKSEMQAPAKYVIHVDGKPATAVSTSKNDCIASNVQGRGARLAAGRNSAEGTTLWAPLSAPIALGEENDTMTISLVDAITSKVVSSVKFQLPTEFDNQALEEMSRKTKSVVLAQLAEKRLSPLGIEVAPLVVQDEKSTIRLLVDISPTGPKLVDIEYQLCGAPTTEWTEDRFQCDSRDVDAVKGLHMAIADTIELMQAQGQDTSALVKDHAMIGEHLANLYQGRDVDASPAVNAAIHRCTSIQFAQVGGPTWDKFKAGVKSFATKTKETAQDLYTKGRGWIRKSRASGGAYTAKRKEIDALKISRNAPGIATIFNNAVLKLDQDTRAGFESSTNLQVATYAKAALDDLNYVFPKTDEPNLKLFFDASRQSGLNRTAKRGVPERDVAQAQARIYTSF